MSEGRRGWGMGCTIAAVVALVIGLGCAGALGLAGWSIWQNPNVQRGVSIFGAAMDLVREAMTAPGTRQMRDAGCQQAMVFTPDLMRRFIEVVEPDAGAGDDAPDMPMIFCAVGRNASTVPTCEDTVRAYVSGVSPAPAELAVRVGVQGEQGSRCEGVYGPDGRFDRPMEERMRRSFGQVGSQASGAP